ncbi:glycosyltransferase [Agromyces archimandritae]|uniref:Glycosyltransferase n=1 Tax=Agromyces archimandritae TaxID=2781962 RepID=A0A975FMP0_9MICO|nr:glycosyltransferase [Agromyces archimandritae]QTX05283.1 glycosyltransferase [Agromyces archimandritae]
MPDTSGSWTTVQNVVFPADRDPDVFALYCDTESWTDFDGTPLRVSTRAHVDDVLSRHSMRIRSGRRVSFASYFNALPASYWQHSTDISRVRLELEIAGDATVLVYRSNPRGTALRVDWRRTEGEGTHEVTFELPLERFADGGWYWFDVVGGEGDAVLERGRWRMPVVARDDAPDRLTLGITTFNKPDYCVRTLATLGSDPELLEELSTVFLVDQGTQTVADESGFEEAAAALGDKLTVIRQPNLGGSGGFSRAMAESLERPDAGYVMLLDDDVAVEPESILRALRFARACAKPTIVGGHMFDLNHRSVLHGFAERVDMSAFFWGPSTPDQDRHDFQLANLRQSPWMHQRMDADYNGWWMCLIPLEIVREIGLSLPVFIKWDDAEYGLRAKAAGYETVSLPGNALWHISWIDKDDSQDWQAYFHARNRIIAALIHSPVPKGGRLLDASRKIDLKHLLSMQYYAASMRHLAIRDVLQGPGALHPAMPTKLAEVRAAASGFREMQVYRKDDAMPATNEGKRIYPIEQTGEAPGGLRLLVWTAKSALRHLVTKPAPANLERPQASMSKYDATWWRTPGLDSALISTADGSGASWYARDRRKFRSLLAESLRLHRRLERNWDRLQRDYREHAAEITSVDAWWRTFDA